MLCGCFHLRSGCGFIVVDRSMLGVNVRFWVRIGYQGSAQEALQVDSQELGFLAIFYLGTGGVLLCAQESRTWYSLLRVARYTSCSHPRVALRVFFY